MARIKDGINTPLSGKIGNLVASNWKGIPYLKSKAAKANQPNTIKQLSHRMKFSTVMKFITPFKDFFVTLCLLARILIIAQTTQSLVPSNPVPVSDNEKVSV